MLASLYYGKPDTTVTSDLVYLGILFPGPLGPRRGYELGLYYGDPDTAVTTDTAVTSNPAYPATLFPGPFGPGKRC